ncbi:MAG: hypothetical protein AAF291_08120 [Pseudomonadota bacterium]
MKKIDPRLMAAIEQQQSPTEAENTACEKRKASLIIALRDPIDEQIEAELTKRGMTVNSKIGDIVTGEADYDKVEQIADYEKVIKVDGAGKMSQETPDITG